MGFIKGLLNFILMLVLSVLLMLWFGYGILGESVLSFEANKQVIETTEFTQEVTDEILSRYKTKLADLSVDQEVLLDFVNKSGVGVAGYVLSEYEEMPSVDVTFLKDYVTREVAVEEAGKLYGNVDFNEMITTLRMIPEGQSVSKAVDAYLEENNLNIHQEDIDKVIEVYLANKDLDDQALIEEIISEMAYDKLNLDQMTTDLSLQQLFDRLMKKNPFTIIRGLLSNMNKNVYGYMTLTMVLIFLMIVITEFRVGTASIWLSLSLIIAIIPLQAIRLVNILVNQQLFDVFNGMESYKNHMLDLMEAKLNVYTIISLVIVVLLFIVSKLVRRNIDKKLEEANDKKHNRFVLVRLAIFAVLAVGLFVNINSMYRYDMQVYEELNQLNPDDFDPQDLDVTLSELLNIEYDF